MQRFGGASYSRGTIYRAPTQNLAPNESRQDIIRLARLTRKRAVFSSLGVRQLAAAFPSATLEIRPLDATAQLRHHRFMEKLCAQCGAAMTCKQEAGCWCAELPRVPMPADAKGCLCRNCLLAKIEALQKSGKRKE